MLSPTKTVSYSDCFSAVSAISLCMLLLGCEKPISEHDNRMSQVAYEEAIQLVDASSFDEALSVVNEAIAAGGLSADQYADALLLRCRCQCNLGNMEQAESDLAKAELGSPNPASFELARGILLSKQGKKRDSEEAFKLAKKIDPSIKIPVLK
jgi:tetratricopeptide (TPR) repeat protein